MPPKPDRKYRFDWQFAIDFSQKPLFRTASIIIFLMPILIRFDGVRAIPPNFWFIWASSVAYFIALAILKLACPRFIQEYRDYGTYEKRKHSHRWIVWEFYSTIQLLKGWKEVIQETKDKKLSEDVTAIPEDEIRKKCSDEHFSKIPAGNDSVHIYKPINYNRDIFLPINMKSENMVLALREKDMELANKEKELFWILFTVAVKEKPYWKGLYWILMYASILMFSVPVIINIATVVQKLLEKKP